MKYEESFFNCNSAELAKKLLGKTLCVRCEQGVIKRRITETEAYGGADGDTACHCFRGRTKRNDPMFCSGGTVYVYLCYGIHEILNVAAGAEGSGQGVMFRGVESVVGPGRVTKILGVDRSFNYEYIPKSDRIWIEEGAEIAERNIEKLKRVGIDFADQKDKERLWRFRLITKPPQNLG